MRTHDDAGSGLVRYSFYSPEMNLIAETEPSTSATQTAAYEYVWFAGAPVAQIDTATSTTHWTFTDHLGTPQIQTNAAGAVDWRAEYEPYGSVFAYRSGATRHQPLRLPGQEYDEAVSGREYNIFRWYASGWGRYTQADPIGMKGGGKSLRICWRQSGRLVRSDCPGRLQ
jgi:RHS repeat-associated protein